MLPLVQSGIVQMATPEIRNELIQNNSEGGELTITSDDQRALLDAASPLAIPDIPTTEAPYDGEVAFGVFITDVGLDG